MINSSWGKLNLGVDIKAQQRLASILALSVKIGTITAVALTVVTTLFAIYCFYAINFENIIFFDGTDRTCILDNGVVRNVRYDK